MSNPGLRDMRRRVIILAITLGLAAFLLNTIARAAAPPGVEILHKYLYAGKTDAAIAGLQKRLKQVPGDDQARFGLGAVEFIQAIEHFEQAMYRHGLKSSVSGLGGLPFFRLPVAHNPNPQPLTYQELRQILQRFVSDLAVAERTLAEIHDLNVALPLNIGLVRLDMNGDGKISDDEALWRIFQRIAPGRRFSETEARRFVIVFDGGDVLWLRAYSHLLMGLGEFLLAYDWHEDFEHTFHALFPRAGLPYAKLNQEIDAYDRCRTGEGLTSEAYTRCKKYRTSNREWGNIADFVAFIHLAHWPVVEPQRMARTLEHLERMVALSRESWRLILAEKDNDHEWIPNPRQTSLIPGMTVTEGRVEGWLRFLDEFEALLQGKKLLPHWRFKRGINLRRVFLEPSTFDPVLWAQGESALPYLEDGEVTKGETWRRIVMLFHGEFLRYAFWFN